MHYKIPQTRTIAFEDSAIYVRTDNVNYPSEFERQVTGILTAYEVNNGFGNKWEHDMFNGNAVPWHPLVPLREWNQLREMVDGLRTQI